ncbi:MAG: ubiquinol-cytochrome c reductase iron-sulfur subunit [Acidobacteriota bacterium]
MNPEPAKRREFLLSIILGVWALMGLLLLIPASVYLFWPPRARKRSDWAEVGSLTQMPIGVPEQVVYRRNRADGWKVTSEKTSAWVVRTSDRDAIAFAPQCPHLGCAYHWDSSNKEFLCPCHASTFSLEGDVLSGPSPRGLDRLAVKVQGDGLLLGGVLSQGQEGERR